ncbi:hypothetical protein BD408DRAFT_412642 [Parasitella parasitica]|nr:hypothetical protein BD408DRAFT_412642 [Parasitella parasitica]
MSNKKVVICVMQNLIPFSCVKQNHTEKSLYSSFYYYYLFIGVRIIFFLHLHKKYYSTCPK